VDYFVAIQARTDSEDWSLFFLLHVCFDRRGKRIAVARVDILNHGALFVRPQFCTAFLILAQNMFENSDMSLPTKTPPPKVQHVLLEVPMPCVLLVTINRPNHMNSLPVDACWEMDQVWKWFDKEDDL